MSTALRLAAAGLLILVGSFALTLALAFLLSGCATAPQVVDEDAPQPKASPAPAQPPAKKDADEDKLGAQFSERFSEMEREHAERYRLALIEGRSLDACRLNNDFILKAQALCNESPTPYGDCWHIYAKPTTDCSGFVNQ